jgi:hypothetical protein
VCLIDPKHSQECVWVDGDGTALGCWRQVCIFGDWHSQLDHGHMNRYGLQGTGLKWVNHSSNIVLPTATIVGPMKIPSRPKVCNPPTVPTSSDNWWAIQSRNRRGLLKRDQVYRGRPDAPTRSQCGSADKSIKERGGRVPPRKAQEGVLGRWDLAP